jgi:hypothetical protein
MPRPYIVASGSELPSGVTPQSGTYLAWLGGGNGMTQSFSQLVTVPAATTHLTLRGFYWVRTQETGTTHPDRLQISIWDGPGNQVLEDVQGLSDGDASGAWMLFSYDAYNTYAGQSINLQFAVQTDGVNVTDFFIDSLALEAQVCP